MKKISIIGAGSAGLFSASNCTYILPDWEIELIHDPSIPPEKVGQGTVPGITDILHRVYGIDWYNNPIKATQKTGIMYKNWGKKHEKFFHPFPMNFLAMHYNVKDLRDYILSSNRFKVIESNIKDYGDIDSDYIIDCTGKPKELSNHTILKNPINSVILANKSGKEDDLIWTDCIATPDGWCFRIPNPDSVSYGYLYNNEITDTESAKNNFRNLFNVEPEDNFSFLNYLSNDTIIDDRILLNGNKLVFLEPLEANSNALYMQASDLYIEYMLGNISKQTVNNEIRLYTKQVENFLLWHYQSGSIYETPFWDYASSFSFFDPNFNKFHTRAKNKSMLEVWHSMERMKIPDSYGQWFLPSFKNWIDNT
jgi:hypothetical protein